MTLLLETWKFITATKKRRRRLVLPILINVVIELVVLVGVFFLARGLAGAHLPDTFWGGLLAFMLGVVSFLIIFVAWIFLFSAITAAIAGPFYGAQIEEVLEEDGRYEVTPHIARDAAKAIGYTAQLGFFFIGIHFFLFLLNIIPGVGLAIGALGSLFLSILFVAMEMFGETFTLLNYKFGDRLRFLFSHFGEVFLFSIPVFLLMLIPVINLFIVPVAMVAASKLFLKLEHSKSS